MKRRLAALLFAPLLVTPASAANWTVDYAQSRLGFTVQWSNEPFSAEFKSWKADIDFDPADLAHARAAVTIDMAKRRTKKTFDSGLRGSLRFRGREIYTAQFLATRFASKPGNAYVATGTLTIRGITKPLTLPFALKISGKTAHMTGTTQIMRLDYDVGGGEWAGEKPVSHSVTVTVDLTATRS